MKLNLRVRKEDTFFKTRSEEWGGILGIRISGFWGTEES